LGFMMMKSALDKGLNMRLVCIKQSHCCWAALQSAP